MGTYLTTSAFDNLQREKDLGKTAIAESSVVRTADGEAVLRVYQNYVASHSGSAFFSEGKIAYDAEVNAYRTLDHPRIAQLLAADPTEPRILLERRGETLEELIRRGEKPTEEELVRMYKDVAEVLAYMDGANGRSTIVELDPSSIVRTPQGSYGLQFLTAAREWHDEQFPTPVQRLEIQNSFYSAPETELIGGSTKNSPLYGLTLVGASWWRGAHTADDLSERDAPKMAPALREFIAKNSSSDTAQRSVDARAYSSELELITRESAPTQRKRTWKDTLAGTVPLATLFGSVALGIDPQIAGWTLIAVLIPSGYHIWKSGHKDKETPPKRLQQKLTIVSRQSTYNKTPGEQDNLEAAVKTKYRIAAEDTLYGELKTHTDNLRSRCNATGKDFADDLCVLAFKTIVDTHAIEGENAVAEYLRQGKFLRPEFMNLQGLGDNLVLWRMQRLEGIVPSAHRVCDDIQAGRSYDRSLVAVDVEVSFIDHYQALYKRSLLTPEYRRKELIEKIGESIPVPKYILLQRAKLQKPQ